MQMNADHRRCSLVYADGIASVQNKHGPMYGGTLKPRTLKTVVQECRVPILPGKRRSSAIRAWEPEAM